LDTHNADEELEKLKSWWTSYGNSVITGIVLGVALLGGITYWKHYKSELATQASMLYDTLVSSARQNNVVVMNDAATRLVSDYSATPYAGKAALILAKQSYDTKDVEGARKHLQWALDHATETATRQVAGLRLARILMEQGALDQALKLANVSDMGGFVSEYQELRGDILLAQGNKTEARNAYTQALAGLVKGSAYERVLKMKRDDLGLNETSPPPEPIK
jgi:predicted negative regulator of RcsB-dependent stress response